MFKCEICNKTQEHGVKSTRVITHVRKVSYPLVRDRDRIIKSPVGFEPVTELTVCPSCSTLKIEPIMVGEKTIEDDEE